MKERDHVGVYFTKGRAKYAVPVFRLDRGIFLLYNEKNRKELLMGKKTEFLYLNEEEIIKAGALDYARCIDVEEEIFKLLT